jgi:hypothetical protein
MTAARRNTHAMTAFLVAEASACERISHMIAIRPGRLLAISLFVLAFGPNGVRAQEQTAPAKVPVTTIVTVLGPHYTAPPALKKADVVVRTGNPETEEVTGWIAAQGNQAPLELAILIDDGTDLSTQVNDMRQFILSQPKTTRVGVFYASGGTRQTAADFSGDHAAVAKKVRTTAGASGTSTSIYLALMDFVSKWQPNHTRHEILLLSDGIDRIHGDPGSPDVREAIQKAQQASVVIHTFYAVGLDRFGQNLLRANYGGGNLFMLADATGGASFLEATDPPIDYKPYFEAMDVVLHNQYMLTFTTARSEGNQGEMRSLGVSSGQDNLEISAQGFVFVPGS